MNTSQLVIGRYYATQQQKNLTPWIVGGVVVVLALFIISNLKRG